MCTFYLHFVHVYLFEILQFTTIYMAVNFLDY